MKLKLRIGKLEEVDEALRPLYVAATDGNGFTLDAEPDPEAAKLAEFRETNRKQFAELEKWKSLGLSPEQAAEKLKAERKKADDDENAKLTVKQLEEKYSKQLADEQEKAEKARKELQAKLDRHEIHAPIRKALIEKGAFAGDVDDLVESLERRGAFRRGDDGKLQFLDADGAVALGVTVDKFADQVRKDRPRWFEPMRPGGAGSKPSDAPVTREGVKQISDDDQDAMNASLEDIAAGKAVVVPAGQ